MQKSFKRTSSLPSRHRSKRRNADYHDGGFESGVEVSSTNFDLDTKVLLVYAEEAKQSANVLHKQQKNIEKKMKKEHSKKLERCKEKHHEHLQNLREAANKILEVLPNTESNSQSGSKRRGSSPDRKRETNECNECFRKQKQIWRLQDDLKSFNEMLSTHVHVSELKNWKQKYNEEKLAKEEFARRLSAMASSKLRDNNPDITDLSDVNRPTKIGEKMSELYDNEWTDAYDEMGTDFSERDAIQTLLDLIKAVYDGCTSIATDHFFETIQVHIEQSDTSAVAISRTDVKLPDTLKQQIKEFRKCKAIVTWPHIRKLLCHRIPLLNEHKLQTQHVQIYIKKCIELCWLMAVQDPPLYLSTDVPATFDTNSFKDYTKRGPYIEFLVWPKLYLHEGGAMLNKGVAQGCKEALPARQSSWNRGHPNIGRSISCPPKDTHIHEGGDKGNQQATSHRSLQQTQTQSRRPDSSV